MGVGGNGGHTKTQHGSVSAEQGRGAARIEEKRGEEEGLSQVWGHNDTSVNGEVQLYTGPPCSQYRGDRLKERARQIVPASRPQ